MIIDSYQSSYDHVFKCNFSADLFGQINRVSSVCDEVVKPSRGRKEKIVKLGTSSVNQRMLIIYTLQGLRN